MVAVPAECSGDEAEFAVMINRMFNHSVEAPLPADVLHLHGSGAILPKAQPQAI
jgi:hypothetical protein